VTTAAASAVVDLLEGGLLDHVRRVSEVLQARLSALPRATSRVAGERGLGLLRGVVLAEDLAPKVVAKARELDIVIFMHPIGFTQGERLMDHYLNNLIGNPLDTTVGTSHLIFGGVMERHPGLKIVLPHAGGFLGHYWARMDHGWRARPDCRTIIKKAPTSYLKKFYFDTITFDPEMLRNLIDKFGAAQVLLGTDYPFDMGEEDPVGLINSVPRLPSAEKERIMGGNAVRLLKIGR